MNPQPSVIAAIKISVGTTAHRWLAENAPDHYALALFEEYAP